MCKLRAFGSCPWVRLTSSVTVLALLIWEDSFTAGCWWVNGPSPDYSAANSYSVITGSSISGHAGFTSKASVRTWPSLDVQFAYAFLHSDILDRVPNFVAEANLLCHRFNRNKGRRNIGGVDLHVFDTKSALPKRLARFQVFNSIELERIGHFIENAVGYFEPLRRKLVNFVFRLEET